MTRSTHCCRRRASLLAASARQRTPELINFRLACCQVSSARLHRSRWHGCPVVKDATLEEA